MGYRDESLFVYKGHIVTLDWGGHIVSNTGVIPGCSGGALLDAEGKVIGVTVASPMCGGGILDSTVLYVPARFAEAMVVTIGE